MTNDRISLNGEGWQLSGWTPQLWRHRHPDESGASPFAEVPCIPAQVPCSVQSTLRDAGLLPDWRYGLARFACEWVENREWMFSREVELPDDAPYELVCEGLDYSGWVLWDGVEIGTFRGTHFPHRFDLPTTGGGADAPSAATPHHLSIVFDLPPRWLGQFGDTRLASVGKPRYYYSWDWMPRFVQTGITRGIYLRRRDAPSFHLLSFDTTRQAFSLRAELRNAPPQGVTTTLRLLDAAGELLWQGSLDSNALRAGFQSPALPVRPWEVNGRGKHPLYRLQLSAPSLDCALSFSVGFREISRIPCQNAPADALPWQFVVNGKPLFIQGINWTPLLPNYADASEELYRKRIEDYRRMGVNLFRVWGGADREQPIFYDLCDQAGILVWQEFPLSSSGLGNLPPDTPEAMDWLAKSADAYLDELPRHPSLALWCGGNELFYKGGSGRPCTEEEPALAMLGQKVRERDAGRGFVPTSSSGPTEYCGKKEYGLGIHHDVHGPWRIRNEETMEDWKEYWRGDDALFHSEMGCPGAAAAALIRNYAGQEPLLPISEASPIWRTPGNWWLETEPFERENGHAPRSVEEYVDWSQKRQAEALAFAVKRIQARFPECGGVILWMGHDSWPCFTNTSLIDYDGNWKPAAYELQKLFTAQP